MQTSKHATDIDDPDAGPARGVAPIHGHPGPALIQTRIPPQLRSTAYQSWPLTEKRPAIPPAPIPTTNRRTSPPTRRASDDTEETLRFLYAQHRDAVLAYATGFTGDHGHAEDITQETFLRAWRHLPGLLDDGRPVRAWLLQVARRLLIDAARAAHARPAPTDENQSAGPAVDGGLDQLLD